MYCQACGAESLQGLNYCKQCGATLNPPPSQPAGIPWKLALMFGMIAAAGLLGVALVVGIGMALVDRASASVLGVLLASIHTTAVIDQFGKPRVRETAERVPAP